MEIDSVSPSCYYDSASDGPESEGGGRPMSILAMILAGGKGERLHPLTLHRAKPAVPFGGIYRIIDFTLSNCINSGIRKIAVLTQYKSMSLDKHLRLGWNFFSGELNEYIISVPPQQRVGEKWYQGTADAIYQNIYMIDYSEMFRFHKEKGADATGSLRLLAARTCTDLVGYWLRGTQRLRTEW